MNNDVVTFGSATVDIFAQTSDTDVTALCSGDHCEDVLVYHPGDKILLEDIHTSIGGGGLNTAACFCSQELQTVFAGPLGKDENGDRILDWMRQQRIRFGGPRLDIPTNTSIILDSHLLDDRTILAYKGASNHLQKQHLDLQALHATWWYSSSLVGESFHTLKQLMRYAHEHDIAFAFNPSAYQTQAGMEVLGECVRLSTLLICNKQEGEMLVGKGDRAQICRRLKQAGAEIVCITEGSYGASLLYADTIYHIDSQATQVVETTGAGDCFASTLLSGLIHELSPKKSLIRASVHAEELIRHVGAQQGLLSKEELDKRVQQSTHTIICERV